VKAAVLEPVLGEGDALVFERARRLGFDGVEIGVWREELRDPERRRLDGLGEQKARTGLEVPSIVLGIHNDLGGVADPDAHVAGEAARDVREAVAWAAELGADAVLVPFFLRAELVDEDGVARAEAAFRALCAEAEARGVSLLYEGTLPAGRVRLLAERVASAAFGCYFDLANPLRRGLDPATEIRELGALVRRVHVKDTRVKPGDCPPGLGLVDFADCARALAEIGYDGWIVLETPPGPPPLVARDLSFTRSVFPALERPSWPRVGAFSYELDDWGRLGGRFAQLGLDAVQLGDPLLAECLADPDAAAAKVAALGLEVAALAGYRNLVAPDPSVRRANVETIARCLELAPALGTFVVATETGTRDPTGDWTDSPENWGEEAWRLLDDALETLVPIAERAGVVLALEASVKNVLRTQAQLLGVLERFPSQHLQVVCDPYNYLSRGLLPAQERHTAALLDRFEHRFALAHLKDVDAGGAEAGTPELGTGVFVQRPYLEFLRDRRPDLPLILEHLPLDHIPDAIARVRALVS
jgi:sugar phosphate isomerase/epimerase